MSILENELVQKAIWNFVVPLVVIFVVQKAIMAISAYINSLWVDGKPDEWILIMNNGKMVRAGIGMKTIRGPFDQVARFPAKINRVSFSTEQVTKEMQGIRMSATLVWTILRTGEGPFLAFKNLGADLNSSNPRTANDALISMSSAIVRNCIANSTIEEMMRDRKGIQDKIKQEMFQVVKGWGVWLETMEVTEVKISSSSLFKDLQTSYRENVRRDSEFCKMKFAQEISEVETKANAEKMEFKRGIDEQKREINEAYNQEIRVADEDYETKNRTIIAEKYQHNQEFSLEQNRLETGAATQKHELTTQFNIEKYDNQILKNQEDTKLRLVREELENVRHQRSAEREQFQERQERERVRLMAELESSNVDALLLRDLAMTSAKSAFVGKSIDSLQVNLADENDQSSALLAGLLSKYEMAKPASAKK